MRWASLLPPPTPPPTLQPSLLRWQQRHRRRRRRRRAEVGTEGGSGSKGGATADGVAPAVVRAARLHPAATACQSAAAAAALCATSSAARAAATSHTKRLRRSPPRNIGCGATLVAPLLMRRCGGGLSGSCGGRCGDAAYAALRRPSPPLLNPLFPPPRPSRSGPRGRCWTVAGQATLAGPFRARMVRAPQHYLPTLRVLSAKTRHHNLPVLTGKSRRSGPRQSPLTVTPPHTQQQRNAAGSIEAGWC
jgi:hypothetical protein